MSRSLHALVSTIRSTPLASLFGKRILVVTGHPDDESYLAAGTLSLLSQCGCRVDLFCATNGEKGASHMKRPVTLPELSQIRAQELRRACGILRIHNVVFGNVPDGELHKVKNKNAIAKKISAFAKLYRPNTIMSFGPDGVTGHLDHIIMGKLAKQVAKKNKLCFVAFALPPKASQRAHEWLISRRRNPHYISPKKIWYQIPTIKVLIDQKIKRKALLAHKSQLDGKDVFTGFPRFVARELLKAEYFVL